MGEVITVVVVGDNRQSERIYFGFDKDLAELLGDFQLRVDRDPVSRSIGITGIVEAVGMRPPFF